MKHYEMMTIYKSDSGDTGAKELSTKVKGIVEEVGGKVTKTDFWGKRKFAYEIKHSTEGYYDVMEFDMEPKDTNSLKKKLNLVNNLVRYLITAQS